MKATTLSCLFSIGLLTMLAAPVAAQAPITEQEAHAIGVDAYIYFYPLVTMDVTPQAAHERRARQGDSAGPMNTFANVPAFPPADMRVVVRPNFDTLYSSAWLDLTKEPMIVSVPDTGGRYYLLPMLDMWTDVFASPGWRTTGTQAGNFLVTPPGWRPDLREKFSKSSSCRKARSASMRRRPMSGSSAAPRRTARRTMTRSTRSRPATRSRRCPNGARRPSRSR